VLESLSYAALLSGIGVCNSSIAVQHSISYAIEALYNAPHGVVSASLLHAATLMNMRKIQKLEPTSTAMAKYATIGTVFSGLEYTTQKHPVLLRAVSSALTKLQEDFKIPKLRDLGVQKDDFYKIASSIQQEGNPIYLAETDVMEILETSW